MDEKLITRLDLCNAIKISDSSLRKYISRSKITEIRKGYIDLHDENNKVCILSYASKKGINAESLLYTNDSEDGDNKYDTEKIDREVKTRKTRLSQSELQTIKIENEIEKIGVETRLKKLELEKKKAKVLPLDFIIEWSALNIRGVFGESINFGNSMIEQMCNDIGADIEIKLKYKKKFKQGFNEILKIGIKKQKPEAITQAKEYSLQTKW